LRKACDGLGAGKDYRCDDFIENLMYTALDFRMDAEKVVMPSIYHFRRVHGLKNFAALERLLTSYPNTKRGNQALALDLWGHRHWTRAGLLRALVSRFADEKVRTQNGLRKWLKKVDFEKHVKGKFKTRYHSIGPVLFNWLRLRCGFPMVKTDV